MLYPLTIFLSAFLLFQVQPFMGRLVLPWFGGSAAVWTACLLFFQVALLVGYLYAWALDRLMRPRLQARTHVALLLVSLAFLPLWPSASWKPTGSEQPTLRILMLLGATVGLPYLLLSSTSPLLQAWWVRRHPQGRPYRLFALSNLGSMLALLSYVLWVEPRFTLGLQSLGWSAGYGVFVACAASCALGASRPAPPLGVEEATTDLEADRPGAGLMALWLGLAGCASLLLMSMTHHVSQNVAPVPFLWVGMLTLYLLSFIICFEGHNLYWRWLYYPALALALQQLALYDMAGKENVSVYTLIPIYMGALFVACMVCHGELARLRPAPRWLTTFYLMTSLGGALGGLFTGVVAPLVLPGYFELEIGMVACPVLLLAVWLRDLGPRRRYLKMLGVGFTAAATIYLSWFLAAQASARTRGYLVVRRNFYGVLKVTRFDPDNQWSRLSLTNGTITHGEQFTSADRRQAPTTYYGADSGVGLAIVHTRGQADSHRVGVVGLGAGTLACYGRPGDFYRFYEINPAAVEIARNPFTYVGDAKQRVEIMLGDARLAMEGQTPQGYHVLAIDAFSSDAIPLHLLTREAFGQYLRHLAPHGILAVHISNHYFDLAPVVRAAADDFHRPCVQVDAHDDRDHDLLASSWVLVGNDEEALRGSAFEVGHAIEPRAGLRVWTDDYTNVLEILKAPNLPK